MTALPRRLARADMLDGLVALTARVAAGGVFWRSALTKLDGFGVSEAAYFLFREEYRLPLIDPDVAAVVATACELLFSALLIVGLAARFSALVLLAMTAVIQLLVYPGGWPEHVLWAAALLVILARGPGAFSADRLLERLRGA